MVWGLLVECGLSSTMSVPRVTSGGFQEGIATAVNAPGTTEQGVVGSDPAVLGIKHVTNYVEFYYVLLLCPSLDFPSHL